MKRIVYYCWMLMAWLLLVCGCSGQWQDSNSEKAKEKPIKEAKVLVYRYGDFPIHKAEMLCSELQKYLPNVELVDTVLALPSTAYVRERNRYRGTGLLDDLRKFQKGSNTILGLTDKIIFTKNEISPTFGIMGISYKKSHLCAVSSVIPKSGKQQTDSNFLKLALHEIGHAYGLPHCPDQKCYMVDAEHRMKLPQTMGFCEKCASYLKYSAQLKE